MKNDTNGIPPELLKTEERLKKNVEATEALMEEHRAVFAQLDDLVNTRNDLIDEGKSICKRHKCSTDLFKTNTAASTEYDPQAFRDEFGPKKLLDACELKPKKVKAMVEAGLLDAERLKKAEREGKETVRVTPRYKPWVVPED